MTTLEMLQKVLVADYKVSPAVIAPDARLDALGIDSLGMLELMFKIEDHFHVKIPGDPPNDLVTVRDVVAYIDQLVGCHAAGPTVAPPPPSGRP